jgi:hypothetical protein
LLNRGFKDGQLICESTHASEFAGEFHAYVFMMAVPSVVLYQSVANHDETRAALVSRPLTPMAVIKFAGGQLWMLSEMLKNPELVLKDRSVMVAMGAMYIIFLIAFLISRHKKQRDSKQFADGVICEFGSQ